VQRQRELTESEACQHQQSWECCTQPKR